MAFIGPGDILVLQKGDGRVRRVINGVLQPEQVLDVAVDNSSVAAVVDREMSSLSSVSTRARLARTRWRSLKTGVRTLRLIWRCAWA